MLTISEAIEIVKKEEISRKTSRSLIEITLDSFGGCLIYKHWALIDVSMGEAEAIVDLNNGSVQYYSGKEKYVFPDGV